MPNPYAKFHQARRAAIANPAPVRPKRLDPVKSENTALKQIHEEIRAADGKDLKPKGISFFGSAFKTQTRNQRQVEIEAKIASSLKNFIPEHAAYNELRKTTLSLIRRIT